MKKILLMAGAAMILLAVAIKLISAYGFVWKYVPLDHYPQGDKCKINSDCVCKQPCCDRCGETGDSWVCTDNRCGLMPYNNLK